MATQGRILRIVESLQLFSTQQKVNRKKAPQSFENTVRLLVGGDTECVKHCNFMSYAKKTTRTIAATTTVLKSNAI